MDYFFLMGVAIWNLKNLAILEPTFFTRHASLFFSALEYIILGYAVSLQVGANEKRRIIAEQKMSESEELRRLLRLFVMILRILSL